MWINPGLILKKSPDLLSVLESPILFQTINLFFVSTVSSFSNSFVFSVDRSNSWILIVQTFLVFQLRSEFNRNLRLIYFCGRSGLSLFTVRWQPGTKQNWVWTQRMGSSDPGHVSSPRNERVSTHENVNFCLIILRLRFFSSQSVT